VEASRTGVEADEDVEEIGEDEAEVNFHFWPENANFSTRWT
jgi:hypothetical protein